MSGDCASGNAPGTFASRGRRCWINTWIAAGAVGSGFRVRARGNPEAQQRLGGPRCSGHVAVWQSMLRAGAPQSSHRLTSMLQTWGWVCALRHLGGQRAARGGDEGAAHGRGLLAAAREALNASVRVINRRRMLLRSLFSGA
jgi:hypothetical protein